MQFDSAQGMAVTTSVNTGAISTSTTTAGAIIDTQGYNSLTAVLNVGARTDGTYTLSVEHGDAANLSDTSTPDATDLVGTTAGSAVAAAQSQKKLGYVGNKRYVRFNIVSTGVTSGATAGAVAILGRPSVGPIAQ
ncbi:hypothetical protein [Rhizobium leguminosarum]|uniref:hypothetical protein n=1 Tax=Rhizobium leguminosarum TaxID=384 RepID=UPI001C9681E5|nr:hypothetical protein [Rhizobium leguminosarum]